MLIKNTNAIATNRRELIYNLYQKRVQEGNINNKMFEVNSSIVLECMKILNHHNDLSEAQRQEELAELVKNLKLDKLINLDILFQNIDLRNRRQDQNSQQIQAPRSQVAQELNQYYDDDYGTQMMPKDGQVTMKVTSEDTKIIDKLGLEFKLDEEVIEIIKMTLGILELDEEILQHQIQEEEEERKSLLSSRHQRSEAMNTEEKEKFNQRRKGQVDYDYNKMLAMDIEIKMKQ